MKLFIGIDPGRKGGIAALNDTGKIFDTVGMTENNYKNKKLALTLLLKQKHWLDRNFPNFKVLIEKPRVWPGKPMQNLTKLIRDAGIWEGWCQAYGMQVYSKTPQEWQEPYRTLPPWRKYNDKRERSYALVEELFGNKEAEKHCLGSRGGILDGVADAILMAYYLYLRRG
jgi:hypothetical protein